jgi:hypothetical protein
MNINTLKYEVSTIQKMTDDNQHTEARQHIAEIYELQDWVTIFKSIDAIHGVTMSLPEELFILRNRETKSMMARIAEVYGDEHVKLLSEAL